MYQMDTASPFAVNLLQQRVLKKDCHVTAATSNGTMKVIRWFEDYLIQSSEQALAIAATQRNHLDKLSEYGIRIPRFTSCIAQAPNLAGVALYNIVEYIAAPRCNENLQSHAAVIKNIGTSILKYYDWVSETNQPLFMNDIANILQYGVLPDGQTPVLFDIEPRFVSPLNLNCFRHPLILSAVGAATSLSEH